MNGHMVVLLLIFWSIKVLISIEARSLYISTKQYAVVPFLHTCWWSFWHILRYGDRYYDFVSSPFLHCSPSFSSFLTSLYLTLSFLSSPYFLSFLVLSSFLLPLSLWALPCPLSLPHHSYSSQHNTFGFYCIEECLGMPRQHPLRGCARSQNHGREVAGKVNKDIAPGHISWIKKGGQAKTWWRVTFIPSPHCMI